MITVVGPEVPLAELVRSAQRRGARVSVVPAGATKAESLCRFAQALDFPSWFGHNLDALADCLHDWASGSGADRTGGSGSALALVWDGVAALRTDDPAAYKGIYAVLDEVGQDHPGTEITVVYR